MTARKKEKLEKDEREEFRGECFTRRALMSSARYQDKKDLVRALLKEDRKYTVSETDEMIEKFRKGKVK